MITNNRCQPNRQQTRLARPGLAGTSSAYLFVDDADALAAQWSLAGAEVHPPQDTEWGKHEGALVDPDGNVIRFGSPIP